MNYFSDTETTITDTGLSNTPSDIQKNNINKARLEMNKIREVLGSPVNVNSWFRSEKVNNTVGGAKTSAHLSGYAIDFWVKGMTNKEICDAIDASGIKYDQLIDEYNGNKYWVHISFDPKMRQQRLIARKVDGKMRFKKAE
jgi:hypothetical protein